MKTITYLFTIAILISSCSITGKYFQGDGLNYHSMVLRKDSTFKYVYFNDLCGINVIEGKWSLKKDTLIINSKNQPDFKPSSVEEKYIHHLNEKLILIQNMDVSANRAVISINEDELIDTLNYIYDTLLMDTTFPLFSTGIYVNIDSISSIRIVETDNWSDCILKDSLFQIKNPCSNFIRIYAEPYNHYYGMTYFTDTKWLIQNNKIYLWREENGDFDRIFFLKKRPMKK